MEESASQVEQLVNEIEYLDQAVERYRQKCSDLERQLTEQQQQQQQRTRSTTTPAPKTPAPLDKTRTFADVAPEDAAATPSAALARINATIGSDVYTTAEQPNNYQMDALHERLDKLQGRLVEERCARETMETREEALRASNASLERKLHDAVSKAVSDSQDTETERTKNGALRRELDSSKRGMETALRDARAAEARHAKVLNEMNAVMGERDAAFEERDAACADRLSAEERARRAESDSERARNELDMVKKRLRSVEDACRELETICEGERRRADVVARDSEILRSQMDALLVEREANLKENARLIARADEHADARRIAMEKRDEARAIAEATGRAASDLEIALERALSDKDDHVRIARRLEDQFNSEKEARRDAERALSEYRHEVERAREIQSDALSEAEAAKRQVHALSEEMRAVLKVRDAALRGSSAAAAGPQPDKLLRDDARHGQERRQMLAEIEELTRRLDAASKNRGGGGLERKLAAKDAMIDSLRHQLSLLTN